jgi:hypothetical protein
MRCNTLAGSSLKAYVKPFFKKHVHEIDENFSVHSAELNDSVIPRHFNALHIEMMGRHFFTWFNLNQSQTGTASAKSHSNNTIYPRTGSFPSRYILERLLSFFCNMYHISPIIEFSFPFRCNKA